MTNQTYSEFLKQNRDFYRQKLIDSCAALSDSSSELPFVSRLVEVENDIQQLRFAEEAIDSFEYWQCDYQNSDDYQNSSVLVF